MSGLPLAFEENVGQAPAESRFVARAGGYGAQFRPEGPVFSLAGSDGTVSEVGLHLAGSDPNPVVEGVDPKAGKVNYLAGNDPDKWHRGISTYSKVAYRGAYRGIDVIYHGSRAGLEYDFVVAPGADPGLIGVDFAGAKAIRIDDSGEVVVDTDAGELRQHRPVSYQDTPKGRIPVESSYVLGSDNLLTLRVGEYDRSRELIIDPVLVASTYLGGKGADRAMDIDVGPDGSVYMVEYSTPGFPTKGGFGLVATNSNQWLVVKLAPDLSEMVYASYLSAGHYAVGGAFITGDAEGNAYVSATITEAYEEAWEPPTPTPIAPRPNCKGGLYLGKISPDGSEVLFGTCLGRSDATPNKPMLAGGGRVWMSGTGSDEVTFGYRFPTTENAFQRTNGNNYLIQVDTTRSGPEALTYSTFSDGLSLDGIDAEGNIHLSGTEPATNLKPECGGGGSPAEFSAKFEPDDIAGLRHVWSKCRTGGKLAPDGNFYSLSNGTAQLTPSAYSSTPIEGGDLVLNKWDADGNLLYGTYTGYRPFGSGGLVTAKVVPGMVADAEGHVFVVAYAVSGPFRAKNTPIQDSLKGGTDAVVAEFDTTRSGEDSLVFSTLLGGSGEDVSRGFRAPGNIVSGGVAVGPSGDIYMVGMTNSKDLPGATGSAQPELSSDDGEPITFAAPGYDSFISRITPPPRLGSLSAGAGPACGANTVRLSGTRLATTTNVEMGSVPAQFSVVDDATVDVVVPPHPPGAVALTLTSSPGSVSIPYQYLPTPIPVVGSISPMQGPVEGNTTVSITGSGLGCVREARFGSTPASSVQAVSDTEVTVLVPPGSRGPVNVVLGADAGDGSLVESVPGPASRYLYLAIPIVNSLSPACGTGGTQALIQGLHLSGYTKVAFGTTAATSVVALPTSPDTGLAVVVPDLPNGDHDVVVTTVDGTSAITSRSVFSVPCGADTTEEPADEGGIAGGPGNESSTNNPAIPTGGTGGTPSGGFVTNSSPGGSTSTGTAGLGGTPPGAGLAGVPVGAGLPTAASSAGASSASTQASTQALSSSASPTTAAAPTAQAAGLVAPGAAPTPSVAGAPNPEPSEPATRYAMVADETDNTLAYGIGACLLMVLAFVGHCMLGHTRRRRPGAERAYAWARNGL